MRGWGQCKKARKSGRKRQTEREIERQNERERARARSTADRGFGFSIRHNEGVRAPLIKSLLRLY